MRRFLIVLVALVVSVSLILSIGLGALTIYANNSIDYSIDEELFDKAKSSNTVTYMAYNRFGELTEVWKSSLGGRKTWVSIEDVSPYLIDGFISAEDREFYSHRGVNIRRTIAAAVNYVTHRSASFGASTITQQVIKNISGDNDYSIVRKVHEIFRAMKLEGARSKQDILEVYLNIVPMSGNIFGVREAASTFFDKEPSELTLHEAATIVGITNAPGKYNPYTNKESCIKKRNNVLFAMCDNGVISDEEYKEAIAQPLALADVESNKGEASSWFIETANEDIIRDLVHKYGISRAAARLLLYNGTKVVLTMNPVVQAFMENYFEDKQMLPREVEEGVDFSMVVSDSITGDLLGIIGGAGEKCADRVRNKAIEPHTPGSTLKPLALYAPLIDKGAITWSTLFDDSPSSYKENNGEIIPYPRNSPDVYEGRITVADALRRSKNTVAVSMYELLGGEEICRRLRNDLCFGTIVEREVKSDGRVITDIAPSPLALGQLSYGVSLRSMTHAYTMFPSCGILRGGRSYYGVFDTDGKVLLDNNDTPKRIINASTANIMNLMLSGVVESGTASGIRLKELVDTAGKTGTSGSDKDRLFIGYTPYFTAGIWCGNGSSSIGSLSKSHLRVWDEVMIGIHEATAFSTSEQLPGFSDEGLEARQFCKGSGLLADEGCFINGDVEWGYYAPGTAPKDYCQFHNEVE